MVRAVTETGFHLMFGVHFPGQGSGFDCISECFGEIAGTQIEADITCEMLQRAARCHNDSMEACEAANPQQLAFHLNLIQVKLRERNCTTPAVTIATTAPTLLPVNCPSIAFLTGNHVITSADIAPEGNIPTSCQVTDTVRFSHCRY